MAWTVEQLTALKDAYAQGVLSVRWGDRTVTYDSRAEMKRRIQDLEAELGLRTKGMRTRIIQVDRGY